MKILMNTFAAAFLLCTIPLSSAHAQIDLKQSCFVSVGEIDTPGRAMGSAVAGNYAYVADRESGLQVIEISTPGSPVLVGAVALPDFAWGVAVKGNYAYVVDRGLELQVIDISTPASPVLMSALGPPGHAHGVTVAGNYLYVADHFSGLQVIDITNPASPAIVGHLDTPGYADFMPAAQSALRVADGSTARQTLAQMSRMQLQADESTGVAQSSRRIDHSVFAKRFDVLTFRVAHGQLEGPADP